MAQSPGEALEIHAAYELCACAALAVGNRESVPSSGTQPTWRCRCKRPQSEGKLACVGFHFKIHRVFKCFISNDHIMPGVRPACLLAHSSLSDSQDLVSLCTFSRYPAHPAHCFVGSQTPKSLRLPAPDFWCQIIRRAFMHLLLRRGRSRSRNSQDHEISNYEI
eukprot:1162694-Pleurochrysis_carterae.AAC.3